MVPLSVNVKMTGSESKRCELLPLRWGWSTVHDSITEPNPRVEDKGGHRAGGIFPVPAQDHTSQKLASPDSHLAVGLGRDRGL